MKLTKLQERRLEKLAEQKRELHRYQEEYEREFGPSDGVLLDTLENYIHEHGHCWIDIETISGNFTSDSEDCGGSLREMLIDMMKRQS